MRELADMNHVKEMQQLLQEDGLDGLLITGQTNVAYVSGFECQDALVLLTADLALFLTDGRYGEAARAAISHMTVEEVTAGKSYSLCIREVLLEKQKPRLGFEEAELSVLDYLMWQEKLEAELIPAQRLFTRARLVKNEAEQACMKRAQQIAELSFQQVLPLITADITERELAAELVYRFLKNGAEGSSFDPIVLGGKRSSLPHGMPGDYKLGKGFVTIDFGVKYKGWCSDTTRTLCLGQPTEDMRRAYAAVLEAQRLGIACVKAGIKASVPDAAAREYLHRSGYAGRFTHSFGHGLGRDIHEAPSVGPGSSMLLPVGAVISAEPGVYLPGEFGLRIEDVLIVTEDGCENITGLPKDLCIL